jgi:hypothetical protein
VVGCGLGGAQADVIGDVVNRLAPLSPSTAHAMIEATRARAALDDDSVDRLADTLVRVGRLVADHPEIDELDLNPVIVSAAGCWVTDAVARVQPPERFNPALRRLE